MYLIINLGLKSIRAIIFTESGRQIYAASRPVHTSMYKDFVEQDAKEWKNLFFELLNELNNSTQLLPEILYITVTTSSSCILGVNDKMEPITKVMMVSDKRSYNQLKDILEIQEFKTLQTSCSLSYTLPKILWYKEHSSLFNDVKYWLNAGDYITYLLTEEVFTDPLNASKALYQLQEGYPENLYKRLGISVSCLPLVKPIGHITDISSELKSKYNLNNCVFIQSTYDAICAVIGSGNGEEGNACDVSGTVTSIRMLMNDPVLIEGHSVLMSQKIDVLNQYVTGASNNLGGGLIEWLKQALYKENDTDVYYKMEYDAIKSSIGASGIIFLPYLLGERAPFISSNIKGEFIGISRGSVLQDFTRAVFEASAFVSRDLLSLLKPFNPTSLSVSGGLARFDIINQIKADVTNLPVYVVDNFESTSIGALLICLLSINGNYTYGELCRKFIQIRKIINPNKQNHSIYNDIYNFYLDHRNIILPHYDAHAVICKRLEGYTTKNIRNL